MFVEYVGITQTVSQLIESRRRNSSETKNDIIARVFDGLQANPVVGTSARCVELGQGVQVRVGEKLYLFLSKAAGLAGCPDGDAKVAADGIYVAGKRVPESRGSADVTPAFHPAATRD